jgi:hypothetical protein
VSVAQTESNSVLLILDASGSMNQVDGSGTPLIDGAKAALREIVHRLPPDANVGLRVYGHRTSNEDPIAGCVDTELVVPVGPIDREALNGAIDSFQASGFTPIGLSLQEAADDLPATGSRTIILVSDGVDTCAPPDPCEVAEQLAVEGFATHIHTVGLFLNDPAAVTQLQCIADAGNGTFSSVDSIDHFFEQLSGLVTEALEGPEQIQLQIQGALVRELAPAVTWVDHDSSWPALSTFGNGTISAGETRWFALDVSFELVPTGQLFVGASIDWQPDAGPDEYLEIQIFDEAGVPVGQPHEVLDVIVEFPQRLYLERAAEFALANARPQVAATTGPRSMFPAWEPDSDWFIPTVERFHDAGLNGGFYGMWKASATDPPLAEGRYYFAVTWSSSRDVASQLGFNAIIYPGGNAEYVRQINERVKPPTWALDLEAAGASPGVLTLELGPWDPSETVGGSAVPLRGIEVWAALEAELSRDYLVHLQEGEQLVVAVRDWFATGEGGGNTDFQLTQESGNEVEQIDTGPFDLKYGHQEGWEAPSEGDYTFTATLRPHDPLTGPAIGMLIVVLAPDSLLESYPAEEFPPSLMRAIMAGLSAVRVQQS